METDKLNNLNVLPLNITCESFVAPSEEDNNADKQIRLDTTDHNIDKKVCKPSEDKQNFRDLLQDRVLKRLQEKSEYGKRNVNSPESKTDPPLKRHFSNEDLWKRVEGRVAAKKATLAEKDDTSVTDSGIINDSRSNQEKSLRSSSSEDIKTRIRSMSKAIGLASSIQNQIKSNDFDRDNSSQQQPKRSSNSHLHQPSELLNTNRFGLGLEQASSVYEETLSQGRFMEDDYFSLPSVGSTQSLFSNISEYRTFVPDRTEDALGNFLQCHSNILQDKDEEPQVLTEDKLILFATELSKFMKEVIPDPMFHTEEVTPVGTPECLTPRATTPTNIPLILRVPESPVMRESSCQYSSDDLDGMELSVQETSNCCDPSPAVSLTDADCQTSIVFEERNNNASYSSRDTSTEDLELQKIKSREEISVQCSDTEIMFSFQEEGPKTESTGNEGGATELLSDAKEESLLTESDDKILDLSNLSDTNKHEELSITRIVPDCYSQAGLETLDGRQEFDHIFVTNTDYTKPDAVDRYVSPVENVDKECERGVTQTKELDDCSGDMSAKKKILKNLTDGNLLFTRTDCSTPITARSYLQTPVSHRSYLQTPTEKSFSSEAEIVESEGVTTINIPCDGTTQPDGSNIQVMVNFWSQDGTAHPAPPHQHNHDCALTCNSLPQFKEAEVDALLQTLNYEDEDKKEKMRKLLEDLDSEHLQNTAHKTLSDSDSDTPHSTPRDITRSRDHTPTNNNPLPSIMDEYSLLLQEGLLQSPPDYFTDSILPGDVYLPPEISDSCDDISLPSVPSYFDIPDTTVEDISDIDDDVMTRHDVMTPRGIAFDDVITPRGISFDDVITPRVIAFEDDGTSSDLQQSVIDSSFGSCDTVILNTALQCDIEAALSRVECDISSKPTQTLAHDVITPRGIAFDDVITPRVISSKPIQTLALPFRLVKFLPVEEYKNSPVSDNGEVEVHGNNIAVQVDMSPGFEVSSCFHNVRQELKWLDHETQFQAKVIDRHVIC
ncbi:uncharacterized protein LOC134822342 isoform X2 [Bolinopsis microptera]|uniref:uncharacterized protein LOC134822342 isoform X2 n=1 Tax=Bolinopsis microptera TaxID=2820187 RepID=UPI003078EEFF